MAAVLVEVVVGAAGASSAYAPLVVTGYASPSTGVIPLDVYFQANVSGGSGTTISVSWQFGDGATGTGLAVRHLYATTGNFTATVTATDSAGDRANFSTPVHVTSTGTPDVRSAPTSGSSLAVEEAALLFAAGAGAGASAIGAAYLIGRRARAAQPQADDAEPTIGSETADPSPVELPSLASTVAPTVAPTEPAIAPRLGGLSPPPAVRRRSSEQILVHLARLGPLNDEIVAEFARTQRGIGERLDLSQNVVGPILRRLADGGALKTTLRHVHGQPRRLKVYFLTPLGQSIAFEILRRSDRTKRAGDPAAPNR